MYKILGADGRQYGPITADQLRRWIVEGRANAQTQTLAEGAAEWKPLGALPEFSAHFTSTAPPAISAAVTHYRKTNGYALWGLICGIVSVFSCLCCCLNVPVGALGLIFSLIGLSQINDLPELYEGRPIAIVGTILSALGLLLGISLLLIDAASGNFHLHHHWNFRRY
ncbi:MAG TPA: DUF4190 domain-containing protein [Verrucomicrobiae bacterium]|jgi:hypothetical protein